MKNILKKIGQSIIFSTCITYACSVGVLAVEPNTISTAPISTVTTTNTPTGQATNTVGTNNTTEKVTYDNLNDNLLPKVSIDKAKQWANTKGNDAIGLLQTVGKPIAIIGFIFSAFFAIFGALGKGTALAKGVVGMGISIVSYTGILFAPEILTFFSSWLGS